MVGRDSSRALAGTQTQVIRDSVEEYFSTSTIHGVRYLTERRRHWTERFWWLIAIGLSMWFCGSFIGNVWMKWRDYPVTMTLTEEQLPISTIPFPTVTVCPEIKVLTSKLDLEGVRMSYYDNRLNLSEIDSARLDSLLHLCKYVHGYTNSNESFVNASIFDTIQDMAPDIAETFQMCTFLWKYDECSKIFVPIITEEGLCFTFNALNSNEIYTETVAPEMMRVFDRPLSTNWSLEYGYKDNNVDSYPFRVYSVRDFGSLYFFVFSRDIDIEYVCGPYSPGFRLYLHTPGDILKSSDVYIRIPFGEDVKISIKPKLITSAEGLRSYKPNQRKCYFNVERQLKFFKIYSEENCKAECLANYTLEKCGCVKFNLPNWFDKKCFEKRILSQLIISLVALYYALYYYNIFGDNSTEICGYETFFCYREANKKLVENSNEPDEVLDANLFLKNCDCLPSCTTITYETVVDRVNYDWKNYYETVNRNHSPGQFDGFRETGVKLFYQSHEITTMKREEQYTNTDFLAICGGILGLCLGVSALSIIELIYCSTLRLFWKLRKWKSETMVIPLFKPRNINRISYIDIY